ncbi:trigger factor [bacterium]|jgi:trigger factor|nr:trigger factor [bacterium]
MTENKTVEQFTFTYTEPESWKQVIGVEVNDEYFATEFDKMAKEVRRKVERPGFRKGKVPMETVKKDYGSDIKMETLDKIVPVAYKAAVVEKGIYPISDPSLDDLKMDEGEPVSFSLSIEVRPEVEAKDYKELALTEHKAEVTDDAVDEVVNRMLEQKAEFNKVDRGAKSGDQLKVDIVPLNDAGEPESEKEVKDYGFNLGAENNFKSFDEGLEGAAAGDTKDIEATYPDDYFTPELQGKTVTYKITVNEVTEKSLPELDDAFAATIKEGQTALELKTAVREDLMREEERKARQNAEDEVIVALVERNEFDLPPSMVEKQIDSSVAEAKQRYQHMGQEMADEDEKKFRELSRDSAVKSLQGMFLLESIRKQEDIEITPELLAARIEELAEQNKYDLEQFKQWTETGNEKERIAFELAEKLAIDFLISNAKIS